MIHHSRFILLIPLIIISAVVLSACSSNSDQTDTVIPHVTHIHGLGFSLDGEKLYMATHHGLYATSDLGQTWQMAGPDVFDLMGFQVLQDGTLLTSGHPGSASPWPNPVGVMESTDQGKTWNPVALAGEIDFHILISVNGKQESLYGVVQSDDYPKKSGLYYSEDQGRNWILLEAEDYSDSWSNTRSMIAYSPGTGLADHIIAGTSNGEYISEDGGASWRLYDDDTIVTAMSWMSEDTMLRYEMSPVYTGLSIRKAQDALWEPTDDDFNLGRDYAIYAAVHPKNHSVWAIATSRYELHITMDSGETWTKLSFSQEH